MPGSSKHFWQYESFDPKSRWLFVNPSEFAESLGLYVIELGHFFQDGHCYTKRVPENSFSINFTGINSKHKNTSSQITFPGKSYHIAIPLLSSKATIVDNRQGYTMETTGKCESFFIQFGGFMAEKYCQTLLEGDFYREFTVNWLPALHESFEQLVLLYRQPTNQRRDVYASMLMTQILSRLILGSDSYLPLYSKNNYVESTLRIMEERFCESLKLKDIAAALHINSSYLSRLITSETGISFSACLSYIRINHAKKLLQSTDLSVEKIGEKCGFCNASHFVKLFHNNEHMTPLQYRNLRRKDIFAGERYT